MAAMLVVVASTLRGAKMLANSLTEYMLLGRWFALACVSVDDRAGE
jgi:hypothetical protein